MKCTCVTVLVQNVRMTPRCVGGQSENHHWKKMIYKKETKERGKEGKNKKEKRNGSKRTIWLSKGRIEES